MIGRNIHSLSSTVLEQACSYPSEGAEVDFSTHIVRWVPLECPEEQVL